METKERNATRSPADVVPVADLTNDALIIRLTFTVNHLSRWLTPIHDELRLVRSLHRGEPSVKDLVALLRDEERRVFPRLHAIATRDMPNLDALPPVAPTQEAERLDRGRPCSS